MSTEVLQDTRCTHCGEACDEEVLRSGGEEQFCCHGCKTVYELLNESGLSSYYDIEENTPGISMRKAKKSAAFEHLDDPAVKQSLLDFSDGKQARVTLNLPQIHCSSCIYLLENLHKIEPAIKQAEVYFDRREASIQFDIERLKLSELAGLLSRIGYEPDLSLDQLGGKKQKATNRPLLLKIGIAGFAFGNIMLFSLPEYLAGPGGIDQQFLRLFGGLNIILALPVLLYSSLDFFKPAVTSVQQRQWSMDIAISLGILAMFFRSLYEILSGYGVGYMDSFTMLVFFLLVGRLFQQKTYEGLSFDRDFKAYFPLSVIRITPEGGEESIAATRIETDDKILIRNGELLPADSILLDDEAWMDFSFVTGEAEPVKLTKGALVYAGGRNVKTSARFKTLKPVSSSYLTRLWNSEVFRKPKDESLHSASARFSRYFSPTVLGVATLAALYWLPGEPGLALNAFTAVLIIACPCAIALSAPFTLGWATKILGKNKVYLKNAEVTEQFGAVDSIVFDKTGTLTHRDQSEVRFVGRQLDTDEHRMLFSTLHENTHPLGRAVYQYLRPEVQQPLRNYLLAPDTYEEVSGKGVRATFGEQEVKLGSASWVGTADAEGAHDTVLASRVYVSLGGLISGYFELRNQYRSGTNELVSDLRGPSKKEVYLLSGDNDREQEQLQPVFGDASRLRFGQSPHDKLAFIEQLKNDGQNVLMIGDGLNDAGALRSSNVGISLAEDTSSFTPASDVIMEADSLPLLDRVLSFSKSAIGIIYISFAISLFYNIIGLSYAVTGTLSPLICAIIMPISSISVILFTTSATHLVAWKKGLRT